MNDDIITATIDALTGKTIIDVEHVIDGPRPYWAVTLDNDSEISFVTMAELVTGPPMIELVIPTKDDIRDYLDDQHCVLWGRSFDIITNPDEAVNWLHQVITGIAAHHATR